MKKTLPALLLIVFVINIANSQKPRVYISEIYDTNILRDSATYDYNGNTLKFVFLYNPEIYDQLVKKIPADKLDYVIKYSQRKNYPIGLRTIDYWNDAALKPAYIYFVTYLKLDGKVLALLEMPAAENKNMPQNMRPATDIYFLTTDFWTNPNYDISGKKQYAKSIVSQNEKLADEFKAFIDKLGDGMIDPSLYFKTTASVPALSKADYLKQFEVAQGIAAVKDKASEEAYILEKQRKEADKQRRIDSIKTEKAKVLATIADMSKQINADLAAGNLAALLTRYRYWKIPIIFKDIEIERTGILNNEHRYYSVSSQIEFFIKPGGVDLVDETVFSATMNTGKMQETNKETFLHGESFLRQANTFIFNNAKGDHYREDAFIGSNEFYREPWNYFLEYVNDYNNIPVVPSFEVINVNVDPDAQVFSVGVKMKMPDRDASVVYTPVEIYNQLDKLKTYNLQIKNIEEEE